MGLLLSSWIYLRPYCRLRSHLAPPSNISYPFHQMHSSGGMLSEALSQALAETLKYEKNRKNSGNGALFSESDPEVSEGFSLEASGPYC